MGQLTQRLNIDPCPNCGTTDFEMLADQLSYQQGKFAARCSNCDIEYSIHYIPPSASLPSWYAQQVEEDMFTLFARNI